MRLPAFLRHPSIWFLAVVVWFATLLFLSSQSNLEAPMPEFEHRDKVLHATYFMLGGICFYMGLLLWKPTMKRSAITILVIAFCALIGAGDEFRQSFTPNRSGNDVYDWMADVFGGILACMVAPWVSSLIKRLA